MRVDTSLAEEEQQKYDELYAIVLRVSRSFNGYPLSYLQEQFSVPVLSKMLQALHAGQVLNKTDHKFDNEAGYKPSRQLFERFLVFYFVLAWSKNHHGSKVSDLLLCTERLIRSFENLRYTDLLGLANSPLVLELVECISAEVSQAQDSSLLPLRAAFEIFEGLRISAALMSFPLTKSHKPRIEKLLQDHVPSLEECLAQLQPQVLPEVEVAAEQVVPAAVEVDQQGAEQDHVEAQQEVVQSGYLISAYNYIGGLFQTETSRQLSDKWVVLDLHRMRVAVKKLKTDYCSTADNRKEQLVLRKIACDLLVEVLQIYRGQARAPRHQTFDTWIEKMQGFAGNYQQLVDEGDVPRRAMEAVDAQVIAACETAAVDIHRASFRKCGSFWNILDDICSFIKLIVSCVSDVSSYTKARRVINYSGNFFRSFADAGQGGQEEQTDESAQAALLVGR